MNAIEDLHARRLRDVRAALGAASTHLLEARRIRDEAVRRFRERALDGDGRGMVAAQTQALDALTAIAGASIAVARGLAAQAELEGQIAVAALVAAEDEVAAAGRRLAEVQGALSTTPALAPAWWDLDRQIPALKERVKAAEKALDERRRRAGVLQGEARRLRDERDALVERVCGSLERRLRMAEIAEQPEEMNRIDRLAAGRLVEHATRH